MAWRQPLQSTINKTKHLELPNLNYWNYDIVIHSDSQSRLADARDKAGSFHQVLSVICPMICFQGHPAPWTRKLLLHEKNYAMIEEEALAIKWALSKLQYFLLGRKFTFVTDHAPLTWMARNKSQNAGITRWFLELQNFYFKVEHRPEARNVNTDALSRCKEALWSVALAWDLELRGRICDAQRRPG